MLWEGKKRRKKGTVDYTSKQDWIRADLIKVQQQSSEVEVVKAEEDSGSWAEKHQLTGCGNKYRTDYHGWSVAEAGSTA